MSKVGSDSSYIGGETLRKVANKVDGVLGKDSPITLMFHSAEHARRSISQSIMTGFYKVIGNEEKASECWSYATGEAKRSFNEMSYSGKKILDGTNGLGNFLNNPYNANKNLNYFKNNNNNNSDSFYNKYF